MKTREVLRDYQVIEADYSSALTLLLRYPSPPESQKPATFVKDALYLRQNLSPRRGSHIIAKYSGRSPQAALNSRAGSYRGNRNSNAALTTPDRSLRPKSPLISPARFLQEQGGIEGILQEAAKGVYNHGEKWGVNKALRGAVQGLQQSGSSSPRRLPVAGVRWSLDEGKPASNAGTEQLTARIDALEQRNKSLAKMLQNAIEDLWAQQKVFDKEKAEDSANALSLAIAKIQFVQVYLEDPLIPLGPDHTSEEATKGPTNAPIPATEITRLQPSPMPVQETVTQIGAVASTSTKPDITPQETSNPEAPTLEISSSTPSVQDRPSTSLPNTSIEPHPPKPKLPKEKPLSSPFTQPRPSLASSSFSWMLGPDHRKSSFVSASHFPPEKKRESAVRAKNGFLFGDEDDVDPGLETGKGKDKHGGKRKGEDEDGNVITMGTLKGVPEGLDGLGG
jgi:TBC1 domain family protein 5